MIGGWNYDFDCPKKQNCCFCALHRNKNNIEKQFRGKDWQCSEIFSAALSWWNSWGSWELLFFAYSAIMLLTAGGHVACSIRHSREFWSMPRRRPFIPDWNGAVLQGLYFSYQVFLKMFFDQFMPVFFQSMNMMED